MEFEWDHQKAAANVTKHGVDFTEAIGVFDDPHLWTLVDSRIATETRYQAIGIVDGLILFVVHTFRGKICRIISARRANRRERANYTLQARHRPEAGRQDGLGTPPTDDG